MKRITFFCVFAVIAIAFIFGSQTFAAEKSRLQEVLERGKVIVGTGSTEPPFNFVDEKGELVGFDIDIAKLIARSLFDGKENIEFIKQTSSARWPNVESGKVDFGIQSATIYPQRATKVSFTRPYVNSGIVILVKKDSPIKSLSDLNNSKYTVANLTNPAQKERSEKHFPNAETITFDSIATQFTAVKTGRADAAQLDVPIARYYGKDNPDVRILEEWITIPNHMGIFSRINDFAWWHTLDTLVSEMRSGVLFDQYSKIFQKWFGEEPERLTH